MIESIKKYKQSLKLSDEVRFTKITHEDAMVADVYKIEGGHVPMVLKICSRFHDYKNEIYFLNHFSKQIQVPKILANLEPGSEIYGAILMEFLPGNFLTPKLINHNIAFEIGRSLAIIHENKTDGFGYLNRNLNLTLNPITHFKEKFEESLNECKNHLSDYFISKIESYLQESLHLLKDVDGPCMIHRDFRPANIMVDNDTLIGIIDWSSARSGFAEDDFCSIEHGEWEDFNGHKTAFKEGYKSIRKIPDYGSLIPLLRLNRAIAVIGFTVKRGTWQNTNAKAYQFNRNFLDNFFSSNSNIKFLKGEDA